MESQTSGISKPMVCQTYGLHAGCLSWKRRRSRKRRKWQRQLRHAEDNSDSFKQGVECWSSGNQGNHRNDKNHRNPGCKPRVTQTTGLETPENTRSSKRALREMQSWRVQETLRQPFANPAPTFSANPSPSSSFRGPQSPVQKRGLAVSGYF